MIKSDQPYLCCEQCNFPIAKKEDVIYEIYPDYLKQKTFTYDLDILHKECTVYSSTNPHDNRFDVVRLRSSALILQHGDYSSDCSWFPPYEWSFSMCPQCHLFLGWKF